MNHYPKHIGDWMTATAHLTEVEECIYSRMTDQYYAREAPLPLDVAACCRLVRASTTAARKAVPTILGEFFSEAPDGWHQKRCDEELALYRERSASASASAQARWTKRNANASADAMRTHTERISDGNASHKPVASSQEELKDIVGLTPDPPPETKNGTALRDAARRVLECLNRNAGRRYEPVEPNIAPIVARIREGYTERDLCAIAAVKARQWKGDEKMEPYIRPKTLFNATNAANYRAELPANKIEMP